MYINISKTISKHGNILKNKYKVESIKLFGSYLEGNFTDESDVDLIVSFKETPSIFEFLDLKEFLEKILNKKVDLISEKGISPYIKPHIKTLRIL